MSIAPSETVIQSYVASALQRMIDAGAPFEFAADMNAGKRGPLERARAKASGMRAGEPDVRVYLPQGRLAMIELKARRGGRWGVKSKAQKARHAALAGLGHRVVTVKADTIRAGIRTIIPLVNKWLGESGNAMGAAELERCMSTGMPPSEGEN